MSQSISSGSNSDRRLLEALGIRTDVILRNDVGDIIAIFDVKTSGAKLGPKRTKELQEKTKAPPGTPVIELHLTNGPIRRADQIDSQSSARHASFHLSVRRS